MPDITLCRNHECPMRDKCRRYLTKPDRVWQSFTVFKPHAENGCEYFIGLSEDENESVDACHSYSLEVTCPKCDNSEDYIGSDHFAGGGFETMPSGIFDSLTIEDFPCGECGFVFNVEVAEGNS